MSSYMDCPHCGAEFPVADELLGTAMKCPHCYQSINAFGGIDTKSYSFANDFYGSSSMDREVWDELGFEEGYDY